MRQDGEPTIEEILESIKRVIAREDRGERLASARTAPADEESRAGQPGSAGPREHGTADEGVLDLARHGYARIGADSGAGEQPLVTEGASASMRGSLNSLAAASVQAPPAAADRGVESGLEPLVRELLRPALSDWLDRNLPAMVERMVAAEIARITQRQG